MFNHFRSLPLKKSAIFNNLSRDHRHVLAQHLEKITLEANQPIGLQWNPSHWLFLIISGGLEAWGVNREHEEFFVGQFREQDLVTSPQLQHDYQIRYTATAATVLIALPRIAVEQVCRLNNEFKITYRELQRRENYRYLLASESNLGAIHGDIIDTLVRRAKRYSIKQNSVLVHEGESFSGFFVLVNGLVNVFAQDKRLGTFVKGDYWGERSFDSHEPSAYTLVAAGQIETLVLESPVQAIAHGWLRLLQPCEPKRLDRRVSVEPPQVEAHRPLFDSLAKVERRQNKRHFVQRFSIATRFSSAFVRGDAKIVDVSDSGLFLESPVVCSPGTEIRLEIPAMKKYSLPTIRATGQIVRITPIGFAINLVKADSEWTKLIDCMNIEKQAGLTYKRYDLRPMELLADCQEEQALATLVEKQNFTARLENISMTGMFLQGKSHHKQTAELVGRTFHCRIDGVGQQPIVAKVVRTDLQGGIGMEFIGADGDDESRGNVGLLVLDLKNRNLPI